MPRLVALPQSTEATVNRKMQTDEEALSAKQAGQPAADRKDDSVGNQIRREHPGALIVAGAEAPRHVWQSHIGDAGVEHLHERGHRHHHGDEPGIVFRPPGRGRLRRRKHVGAIGHRLSAPLTCQAAADGHCFGWDQYRSGRGGAALPSRNFPWHFPAVAG